MQRTTITGWIFAPPFASSYRERLQRKTRTLPEFAPSGTISYGLCSCIDCDLDGKISDDVAKSMHAKIEKLPSIDDYSFRWPNDAEGAKQRAAFCRKMAAKLTKKRKKV